MFHCIGCGVCRQGGRHNYTHCYDCNKYIPKKRFVEHKIKEHSKVVKNHICPICFDEMDMGNVTCITLKCGHTMHRLCYKEITESNQSCPECSEL